MTAVTDWPRRILRRTRRQVARVAYQAGIAAPRMRAAAVANGFRHPIDVKERVTLIARYRQLFPGTVDREMTAADLLMRHEFHVLGHTIKCGTRIEWLRDPVSGRDWPSGFSDDIEYRGAARVGDIKLPWELNKHQYFFTLGKAAWISGDRRFATEIVRQIGDWIDRNPYRRGINWISALEVGARAISWIMTYPFYAAECDQPFRERLAEALALHMHFIEGRLSRGRFTNTHIVGEAAALVAGGLFLDCRASARWLARGLALLDAEIERQVTRDGVHVDSSIAYHRFFLDHYYLSEALLAANGRRLSTGTRARMRAMARFLAQVVRPDGTAAALGDGDDARGLWLHADCISDYRPSLALAAVLFEDVDFAGRADVCEELLWLFGEHGIDRFRALSCSTAASRSVAFHEVGYYVMRSGKGRGESMLVFDCGSLGPGPAAHSHADALSFELYADGYAFIADPGTFSYNLDYSWRDVFRSTRAHNTVVIDGYDQSVAGDRMSWKRAAQARCHRWITDEWFDLVDGEHDGYKRLPDPVTHRRVVVFLKPDAWVIVDRITSIHDHELEALFHLRPDCAVEVTHGAVSLESPGGRRLYLAITIDEHASSPTVLSGSEEERAAWFSCSYGVRQPSRVISVRHRFRGEATIITCASTASAMPRAHYERSGWLSLAPVSPSPLQELRYRMSDGSRQRSPEDAVIGEDLVYRLAISHLSGSPSRPTPLGSSAEAASRAS